METVIVFQGNVFVYHPYGPVGVGDTVSLAREMINRKERSPQAGGIIVRDRENLHFMCREMIARTDYHGGRASCLSCRRVWLSPNKRTVRVCPKCRPAWEELAESISPLAENLLFYPGPLDAEQEM